MFKILGLLPYLNCIFLSIDQHIQINLLVEQKKIMIIGKLFFAVQKCCISFLFFFFFFFMPARS